MDFKAGLDRVFWTFKTSNSRATFSSYKFVIESFLTLIVLAIERGIKSDFSDLREDYSRKRTEDNFTSISKPNPGGNQETTFYPVKIY